VTTAPSRFAAHTQAYGAAALAQLQTVLADPSLKLRECAAVLAEIVRVAVGARAVRSDVGGAAR
jgi:hypothetical protein